MSLPAWTLLIAGPLIGSWLGVLVRRLPLKQPVTLARSSCEHCGHVLGPVELVPLASFVLQSGHCRYCKKFIGWFYPTIELAALVVAAIVYYVDGDNARAWVDASLGWTLLCVAWIDIETLRLPDSITLPLVLAGLAVTLEEQAGAIYNHAAAAALGYLGFRMLDALYLVIRNRHGLGIGDAKLLGAAGAWLGLAPLPDVVLGASLIGIITSLLVLGPGKLRSNQIVAFGPALALAFFLERLF